MITTTEEVKQLQLNKVELLKQQESLHHLSKTERHEVSKQLQQQIDELQDKINKIIRSVLNDEVIMSNIDKKTIGGKKKMEVKKILKEQQAKYKQLIIDYRDTIKVLDRIRKEKIELKAKINKLYSLKKKPEEQLTEEEKVFILSFETITDIPESVEEQN